MAASFLPRLSPPTGKGIYRTLRQLPLLTSTEESTVAEKPAGRAQSLPAPTVVNTLARQRWLSLAWRVMRALSSASPATSGTGQKKHPTADGTDLLDTAECIRRDVLDKATLEIPGWNAQIVEQQDMEHSRDVSPAVTPTAAGAESRAHHPTADAPVFLNADDYIRTEVIKKAVLVVQRPFEEPEEPYIPAPSERKESPGHTITDDDSVFLDANDYIHTEIVKKAVLMVQKPFEYPEEQ